MPKCPKCGEEISKLICYVSATYLVWIYDGEIEYTDLSIDTSNLSYHCPICNKCLFESEKNAEKFLKGEIIDEQC